MCVLRSNILLAFGIQFTMTFHNMVQLQMILMDCYMQKSSIYFRYHTSSFKKNTKEAVKEYLGKTVGLIKVLFPLIIGRNNGLLYLFVTCLTYIYWLD